MRKTSEESSGDKTSYFFFLEDFTFFLLSCCTLIVAVAIVGNLMVCYVIMVDRNLRNNPMRLFLLSLVISDLVTLTVVAPLDIAVFFCSGVLLNGEHLCKIFTIIFVTSVPSSVWTLLPISIWCLKNLSDPLNHLRRSPFLTSKRALIAIIFIWLYNVLFAAIPSMVWRDAPDESLIFKEVCWFPQSRAYALIPVILNFILPLIITSGIHCFKIYLIAHQRKRTELVGDSLSFIEDNKTYLENMKDGKSIVMFIAVFFFCWLPYSTVIIFISLCNSCWAWIPEDRAFYFLLICGYLNSALNPILFAIWNRSFKAIYLRLLSLALSKSHPNNNRPDGKVS